MKYYLLLIIKVFFLLSISAAISLFFTSFGIFGYVAFLKTNSLAEAIKSTTELVIFLNFTFSYSGFVTYFGFVTAWPAIYILSYPYCLYLKFNNIQNFSRWVIPLTFIGFIYSFFLHYIFLHIGNFKQPALFWINIVTITAFMTSIFTWFFCNKLSFTLHFGIYKPKENFRYYLLNFFLRVKVYFLKVIWPEIRVFKDIDLYIAWRWLIVLLAVLSLSLYFVQAVYLIAYPITDKGLSNYINWTMGFLLAPVVLIIQANLYIVMIYCLSVILVYRKNKDLKIWVSSFVVIGVICPNNYEHGATLRDDFTFIFVLLSLIVALVMRYIYIKSNINILKTGVKNE